MMPTKRSHSEFLLSDYFLKRKDENRHTPCQFCCQLHDYREKLSELSPAA